VGEEIRASWWTDLSLMGCGTRANACRMICGGASDVVQAFVLRSLEDARTLP
jgi:hypothetical protein